MTKECKDYTRYSKSRYYIKTKAGGRLVSEHLEDRPDVETIKLATHNSIAQYVIDIMVVAGFALYNKSVIENMTYLVMCR